MARPLAYITAVWSDEPHEAKEEALRFSRQVYDAGYSPICPMLMYMGLLKDNIPKEFKDKQDMSLELLRRCRILVVCGNKQPLIAMTINVSLFCINAVYVVV